MANISQVYLLDTPLEDDLKHTLYFANATAQHTYMSNNIVKSYVNVSYQRDTSTFRCPAHIDTIRQCNYMMYQNTAYSNKWFYCFIEKMTYISDGLTDVEFKVDPIQTFMFDFETQLSFVEREHTNDDGIGKNVLPENFELGEYVETNLGTVDNFNILGNHVFAMAVTKLIDELKNSSDIMPLIPHYTKVSDIPDGFIYIGLETITDVSKMVALFNATGHGDYINSLFVVPNACFTSRKPVAVNKDGVTYNIETFQNYVPKFDSSASITTSNTLSGNYSPRNL